MVRVSPFLGIRCFGVCVCSKMWVPLVSLEKPREIPLGELLYAFNMIQSV
jgi:hypothetical protein